MWFSSKVGDWNNFIMAITRSQSAKRNLKKHPVIIRIIPFASEKQVKEYSCHICDDTFQSRIYLKHHIENIHKNPTGQVVMKYSCHICDGTFETRICLKHHIENVHKNPIITFGQTLKKYSCHICDETFEVRINLQQHIENLHSNP